MKYSYCEHDIVQDLGVDSGFILLRHSQHRELSIMSRYVALSVCLSVVMMTMMILCVTLSDCIQLAVDMDTASLDLSNTLPVISVLCILECGNLRLLCDSHPSCFSADPSSMGSPWKLPTTVVLLMVDT